MKTPTSQSTDFTCDGDHLLDDLLDQIGQLVEAGELAGAERLIEENSQYAQQLRRVLPAIEALAAFEQHETAPMTTSAATDISPEPEEEKTLGDFRIVREIGRGGMGVVYEARQISLGRRVALKVLPYAALMDARQLERFQNEARVAAGLHHTNIVPVYTVGCERGVYFYAMQFIEGRDLAGVIDQVRHDQTPPPPSSGQQMGAVAQHQVEAKPHQRPNKGPERRDSPDIATVNNQASIETPRAADALARFKTAVQLAASAADALAYAHSVGVLHRDIKPANLLVDQSGTVWVSDFGLARLEADTSLTTTGDLLGTLRYMSPEQARGDRTAVDARSDIYALGVTLYELLTLQPAHQADDRQRLLADIGEKEPTPPGRVDPRIPSDLDAIVQKAIEKEPTERYQSAEALAADLRNFLANRPVVARPPSLTSRSRKWLRRHRSVVRASVITLLTTLLASAVFLVAAFRSERAQRQLAQQHAKMARQTVDEMLTKVATTWVASDPAVSAVQRQFLRRALDIYQHLVKNPPDGNPHSADSALAHERIADIYHHLGRQDRAISALETALQIRTSLAGEDVTTARLGVDLARSYRKLAQRHYANWNLSQARQMTDRGIEQAQQRLAEVPIEPNLQRELARLLYQRAKQLLQEGQIDKAAAVAEQPAAHFIDKLELTPNDPLDDLVLGAEWANLRATIYRRQNRLDEAAEVARQAIARYSRTRNSTYYDAKRLLVLDADLHQNLAETMLAQDHLQQAVDHFRTALGLRGQRLGGRTAAQLGLAVQFDRQQRLSSQNFEGLPQASYVETQLCLVGVLPLVDRPYEARSMAGEALLVAGVISGTWNDNMPFRVLHANTAAVVSDLLAATEDPEAEHYLQLSAALWKETNENFPQAKRYTSGMQQAGSDWDWFRSTHPQHASEPPTRESYTFENEPSAFMDQARGRAWFEYEDWPGAINFFAKAAEQRDSGQAFDWFHLSMAYHHLGKLEEAQKFYEQAAVQLQENNTPNTELESLRRNAALLLEVDVLPTVN